MTLSILTSWCILSGHEFPCEMRNPACCRACAVLIRRSAYLAKWSLVLNVANDVRAQRIQSKKLLAGRLQEAKALDQCEKKSQQIDQAVLFQGRTPSNRTQSSDRQSFHSQLTSHPYNMGRHGWASTDEELPLEVGLMMDTHDVVVFLLEARDFIVPSSQKCYSWQALGQSPLTQIYQLTVRPLSWTLSYVRPNQSVFTICHISSLS